MLKVLVLGEYQDVKSPGDATCHFWWVQSQIRGTNISAGPWPSACTTWKPIFVYILHARINKLAYWGNVSWLINFLPLVHVWYWTNLFIPMSTQMLEPVWQKFGQCLRRGRDEWCNSCIYPFEKICADHSKSSGSVRPVGQNLSYVVIVWSDVGKILTISYRSREDHPIPAIGMGHVPSRCQWLDR